MPVEPKFVAYKGHHHANYHYAEWYAEENDLKDQFFSSLVEVLVALHALFGLLPLIFLSNFPRFFQC